MLNATSFRFVRRFLIGLAAAVATVYALIIGCLYVAQRDMLYTIRPEPNQPIAGLKIHDVRIQTPDGETL